MLLSSSVMLLRSLAIRKSVFLAIWNSSLAARILLRSSVMSLTFKPCVCTRIARVARFSVSVSWLIFSAFACVGMYICPPFLCSLAYSTITWPSVITEGHVLTFIQLFGWMLEELHALENTLPRQANTQ